MMTAERPWPNVLGADLAVIRVSKLSSQGLPFARPAISNGFDGSKVSCTRIRLVRTSALHFVSNADKIFDQLSCSSPEGRCTLPPRPKSTADEILALTFELIAEHDVSGVSVDMVAAKSGVSKATIYRRWPSREALIQATIDGMRRPARDPDTGSLRGDLTILLNELVGFLNRPVGGKVFAAFLNAAVRNPNLSALNREMTRNVRTVYETVIARAVERGELAQGIDVRLLIDLLISPFLYRLLVDNSEARQADIQPVIDVTIKAFGPCDQSSRDGS